MVMKKSESGFNLVELMVVVGIIGILSAVAVPRFQTFKARAQQTEAKSGLNALYLSMQAAEANLGTFPLIPSSSALNHGYGGVPDAITGFAVPANAKYVYRVHSEPAGYWAALAYSVSGFPAAAPDIQRTNARNYWCAVRDGVTNTNGAAYNHGAATGCPQVGVVYAAIATANDGPL